MRQILLFAAACIVLTLVAAGFQTQNPPAAPGADPYANNPAAGTSKFPLAAPAGAVNQGAFSPATWKYGTAFDAPANSKIWNPVKLTLGFAQK
jgi:hypothetical protein